LAFDLLDKDKNAFGVPRRVFVQDGATK